MMEIGVIATLIAAGVPIFLAIVGGIIWIVREFGKVNSRLFLLERSVKRLENLPLYQVPVQLGQDQNIEGFEIIIRAKESDG